MKLKIIIPLIFAILLIAACKAGETSDSKSENEQPETTGQGTIDERTVPPNPVEKVNEDGVIVSHAISLRSEPKYPEDFEHFSYVNPNAPKGGSIVFGSLGTYDTFHRYALRGDSAPMSDSFYDSLMVSSSDEIEVYYGLIAEKIEYPPEYDWIIFHLRPQARFQDGKAILAEDVVFSFNTFLEQGVPQFRAYYEPVNSVEALDERRVKFTLSKPSKAMLIDLGQLRIIPRQFWEDRDFGEPIQEIPLASGPYKVSDFSMGQYVTYERLKDYWAMDLPVIKGTLNFDSVHYDMYRDEVALLEALKAGDIDFRQENVSKSWATGYSGANFDAGYIIKEEIPHEIPPGMQSYVFNTERKIFSDRRVREALSYGLDFEWINKNLFYNQYVRTRSVFQSTPFESLGLPSQEELAILEPIRDSIPPEVFLQEFNPPETDGSGQIRAEIVKAKELLNEAGYEVIDQLMTNTETGEALEFELLIYSPTTERIAIPLQENYKKMGITMNIRMVDTTQFINRYREGDYDFITSTLGRGFYPDTNLELQWHSDFIDSTYNSARVQDDTIDYLIEGIVANQEDNRALLHWGRAFDRVVQWRFYGIPQWHINTFRIAYWNKFGKPEINPKYALGIGTWWYDENKAAELPGN